MKKVLTIVLLLMFLASASFAATINLQATWTANTEPDMASYRLYRTDGARSLVGSVPHPATQFNFTVTVPDNSQGTLSFVLTAVDTSGNESLDSPPASYGFNTDVDPPAAPKSFSVSKQ